MSDSSTAQIPRIHPTSLVKLDDRGGASANPALDALEVVFTLILQRCSHALTKKIGKFAPNFTRGNVALGTRQRHQAQGAAVGVIMMFVRSECYTADSEGRSPHLARHFSSS